MAEEPTESSRINMSATASENEEANRSQEEPGNTSYGLGNESNKEDQLSQMIEDHIGDLCTLRRSIPGRLVSLLKEKYEARKPIMLFENSEKRDVKITPLSFDGLDECHQKSAELAEMSTLSKELQDLTEQYKSQLQYATVKSTMDLNDTQDLLFSEQRKRKHSDSKEESDTSVRILRPGREHISSSSTPIIKSTPTKPRSSSRIPVRRPAKTPNTPLSTRSWTKRFTRSADRKLTSSATRSPRQRKVIK